MSDDKSWTLKRKFLFCVVNACTSLNTLLGVAAIFLAPISIVYAAICVGASTIFDAVDGFLARRWQVNSGFGAQLDSLGDFSSFGMATGVIGYYWVGHGAVNVWAWVGAAFYILCAAIRLARYNANTDSLCPPAYFEGLPSTAAACSLAALVIFGNSSDSLINLLLLMFFGALMVSRLPYPKLTRMGWMPKWVWLIPVIMAFFSTWLTAWLCVGAYAVSGFVVALRPSKRRGNED